MKVNVGNQKTAHRYQHDRSHDVSTTSDFGFMQPLMIDEVIGNSTSSVRTGQIVRLMPLAKPVFGSMYLKTYHVFCPMESIFHPYGSFRSGQTYMGANATYIPTQVISFNLGLLSYLCKIYSKIAVIDLGSTVVTTATSTTYDRSTSAVETAGGSTWTSVISAWQQKTEYDIFNGTTPDLIGSFVGTMRSLSSSEMSFDSSNDPLLDGYDFVDVVEVATKQYAVVGKYTIASKNLRKIFYGCGYKLIDDYEKCNALPLFAYWKVYYDLFYPQRDMSWKDTAAAGLQEWMEQYGRFDMCASNGVISQKLTLFRQFVVDLASAYYTKSPDFVSSHITGQRISTVPTQTVTGLNVDNTTGYVTTQFTGSTPNTGVGITSALNGSFSGNITSKLLSQSNLDLLQRLYHRVNAHTAIGGDIRAFLKSQLGVDYLDEDESYWIGSTSLDISVDPVFSEAHTSEAMLGEFAGQGVGADKGKVFTFDAKTDGYWVILATIVPDARYAQCVDMQTKHVGKYDFYDPAFDSLTLLPTPKKYIFAENNYNNLDLPKQDFTASFGNIPNYIEYCCKPNLINGDMSLPSTRKTYLPFNLDTIIPYTNTNNGTVNTEIASTDLSYIVNGTIWRYVGLYQWIGNYQRIFQNAGFVPYADDIGVMFDNIFIRLGFDDNFIIHNYIDYKQWNTKLPCRDAYQTGAFDSDSFAVEKA